MAGQEQLSLSEAVFWRTKIWTPAVKSALDRALARVSPADTHLKVLELGYGKGLMACYLAQTYGWHITGYEVLAGLKIYADRNAARYHVTDLVDFQVGKPDVAFNDTNQYDIVFTKSFFFIVKNQAEYIRWLELIRQRLRPGGLYIGIENGQGSFLEDIYRRLTGRWWADTGYLYCAAVDQLMRDYFTDMDVELFSSASFLFGQSKLRDVEKRFLRPNNAFVAAIVANKPQVP